jgi:hypothetical protein
LPGTADQNSSIQQGASNTGSSTKQSSFNVNGSSSILRHVDHSYPCATLVTGYPGVCSAIVTDATPLSQVFVFVNPVLSVIVKLIVSTVFARIK